MLDVDILKYKTRKFKLNRKFTVDLKENFMYFRAIRNFC